MIWLANLLWGSIVRKVKLTGWLPGWVLLFGESKTYERQATSAYLNGIVPKTLDNLIAHSAPEGGTEQSMREHLGNVAALASSFAAPFGSAAFAEWLGWWHDAGKVADDVQAYLTDSKSTPPGPDHSSAGMLEAVDRFEPFAFNIAGHHGGLPDASDLKTRIQRKREEKRVVIARA